jgi:TRAP-type C4-dicarboxylate transport system substrate-binding protein
MYRSVAEVDYVRQHLQASIEHNMEERGFVVLAWSTLGFAKHFSKQPALLPADFLRMKMFVGENDLPEIKLLNAIGGHPVGLNWTTALQALQTGMVEEIPTLPEYALASQYNTAVTNMLDLKWAPVTGAIVVVKKTWDALAEPTREAMKKSAAAAAAEMQTAGFTEDAAAVAAMQKRGLQVHAVSPQAEAQWQKFAADAIWPKMRGTMVPADSFDQVEQLVTDYRKKSGTGL